MTPDPELTSFDILLIEVDCCILQAADDLGRDLRALVASGVLTERTLAEWVACLDDELHAHDDDSAWMN